MTIALPLPAPWPYYGRELRITAPHPEDDASYFGEAWVGGRCVERWRFGRLVTLDMAVRLTERAAEQMGAVLNLND